MFESTTIPSELRTAAEAIVARGGLSQDAISSLWNVSAEAGDNRAITLITYFDATLSFEARRLAIVLASTRIQALFDQEVRAADPIAIRQLIDYGLLHQGGEGVISMSPMIAAFYERLPLD